LQKDGKEWEYKVRICRDAGKSLAFLISTQPKEFFSDGLKKLEQ
jgi:hypothetical protein